MIVNRPSSRKKNKKDKNAPKRPRTAFLLFSVDKREGVKSANPSLAFGDIAKEVVVTVAELQRQREAEVQQPGQRGQAEVRERDGEVQAGEEREGGEEEEQEEQEEQERQQEQEEQEAQEAGVEQRQ